MKLKALNQRLLTTGPELRVFLGLYMLLQGSVRLLTGHSAASINIFTAQIFGSLMALTGLSLLLTTKNMRRCNWAGRIAAIASVAVWFFAIFAAWPAQAWVSIVSASYITLALINEVRIHDC